MNITTPVPTILDVPSTLPEHRFEFVVDEARRHRLVAERPLREALDRLGRRGRSGTRALRSILDSGELQRPVPGSPFERRFIQFLNRRRLPVAECQFVIEIMRATLWRRWISLTRT